MKKFVVWGIAVCAAVVAQATSFTWRNFYAVSNSNGVYAVGGTVYLIDGADGHGGISQSDLVDKIKGGETIAWTNYTFYSATLGTDGKSFTAGYLNGQTKASVTVTDGSVSISSPSSMDTFENDLGQVANKPYASGGAEGQFLNSGDFYSVLVAGDGNYYFSEVVSVNVSGQGTTDVKFNNTATGAFAAGDGGWYKVQAVPEPTSGLLMLVGLSLLGLRRKPRA